MLPTMQELQLGKKMVQFLWGRGGDMATRAGSTRESAGDQKVLAEMPITWSPPTRTVLVYSVLVGQYPGGPHKYEEVSWWAADYYGLGRDAFGAELRAATMLEL